MVYDVQIKVVDEGFVIGQGEAFDRLVSISIK